MLKRCVFYAVMLLPSVLLIVILLPFASNLRRILHVDPAGVMARMEQGLEERHYGPEIVEKDPRSRGVHQKSIFVFGGSSVVASDTGVFPDNVFSGKLQKSLDQAVITNFGRVGVDSFYIKDKVKYVTAIQKPDIIILYAGHNDYTNGYRRYVRHRYNLLRGTIVLDLLKLSYEEENRAKLVLEMNFEPKAHSMLSFLRIFEPDAEVFARYDRLIERYFERNLREIVEFVKPRDIALVLVTPISNLDMRPVGGRGETRDFERAQEDGDYDSRIARLMDVRDRDWLAPAIRAKSRARALIAGLADREEGIHVMDLEGQLMEQRFGFGFDEIYDNFHLVERTHQIIADSLAGLLERESLLD